MGKKLDKKAEPAAGKTSKGMKVDKAVKKFRKLEGKLWTREYLLKIAEFDGAYELNGLLAGQQLVMLAGKRAHGSRLPYWGFAAAGRVPVEVAARE